MKPSKLLTATTSLFVTPDDIDIGSNVKVSVRSDIKEKYNINRMFVFTLTGLSHWNSFKTKDGKLRFYLIS